MRSRTSELTARRVLAATLAFTLGIFGLSSNCAVRGWVEPAPVARTAEPVQISTPVKAHLFDGSTVVFPGGATLGEGVLRGTGTKYDLTLKEVGPVSEIPLDQVLAVESFQETTARGLTVLASGGATALTVIAAAALALAIFGSCPTVYSNGETLESELFSYSIAPLFEMTDVDRLHARPGPDGIVELEVRNEALETHYLNHLELLEVRHSSDEIIMPDERGEPVALKEFIAPRNIVDRTGRSLVPELEAEDDLVFRTDPAVLAEVNVADLRDSIEMSFPVPAGREEVALVFRLRNSLLNTVLLYDVMLAGPASLDWLGRQLGQIRPALELASWYSSRMGMRVEVWQDDGYREVGRVPDTGPIAWKDAAILVPTSGRDNLRVRLTFVADNWRIDHLRIATSVRKPSVRTIPAAEIAARDGTHDLPALRSLQSADQQYLQTTPGQSFRARFDVGEPPGETLRTFLLSSRGYYTEWIRASWLKDASASGPFKPGDGALLQAITRWKEVQPEFEARFHATRIPVH